MLNIKLKFWLGGGELGKLVSAAQAWWEKAEGWVQWPLTQLDPMSCSVPMLDLLAWQRDITRFADEPLALYRLRVRFAFVNAEDAGSKAGFIKIYERLGLGYIEIEERFDAINWDVIRLSTTENYLADKQALVQKIIEKYGRTCRRYELLTIEPLTVSLPAFSNENIYSYDVASL